MITYASSVKIPSTAERCSQVRLPEHDRSSVDLSKLMRNYAAVPTSWYIGLLAVNFGAAGKIELLLSMNLLSLVLLVKTTPLQMPIWALVLSVALAMVCYRVPRRGD